jgi:hypothetical protein
MSQKDESTPESPEVNNETPANETEAPAEETIADAIKDDAKDAPKVPDSIPYDRFKEKVDETKDLKDKLEALEKQVADNSMSNKEVSAELSDIAKEHDLDASVLDKVATAIEARAEKKIEERLAPLNAKERAEKQDKILTGMLDKALENNPDYQDVVNQDVIKQLALNPANSNKSMSQLIQETYSGAIKPSEKKTMETTSPGKSETITSVDYDRAQTDSEYFTQIKSDPALKAEYNKQMLDQISRVI